MSKSSAFKRLFLKRIKGHFLTGLLVLVPLGMTILVVRWIVNLMDRLMLQILPTAWQPEQLFGKQVPGLGLIVTFLLILLVGVLAANIFGRSVVSLYERLVDKIPLVKGIYNLFKQVSDTVLNRDRDAFRKVVLIEYPRKGLWAVAFVTGISAGEVQEVTSRRLVNIFVPTTPNPTSGFYILVPEDEMIELKMTVEEAFKLVISGGMVTPPVPAGVVPSPAPSGGGRPDSRGDGML